MDSLNQTPEEEIWLPVVGYEDRYHVSSLGRLLSLKFKRGSRPGFILSNMGRSGYLYVPLCDGSAKKTKLLHRLVASAFLGPCPVGLQVNHKNGVKSDNRIENLEYVTRSENLRHAWKMGLMVTIGERHSQAKLKNEEVLEIKKRILEGEMQSKIASDFNVSKALICCIKSGKRWNHLEAKN